MFIFDLNPPRHETWSGLAFGCRLLEAIVPSQVAYFATLNSKNGNQNLDPHIEQDWRSFANPTHLAGAFEV